MTKESISEPTNGGKESIETGIPYIAHITIVGSADLLLHAWNCEAVEEKARAKKGSEAKKSDNVESYVMRNEDGMICLPSEYLRMSVVNAAKFRQDPRSPRKSAMDLFKACVVSLSPLSPIINRDGKVTKGLGFSSSVPSTNSTLWNHAHATGVSGRLVHRGISTLYTSGIHRSVLAS